MEEDYVELEMDPLNQHECMAAMIAVIKHMQRTKITPEVTAVGTPLPYCVFHITLCQTSVRCTC